VRVVCPITDAFVAHHGALGGFVRVWLQGKASAQQVMAALAGTPGIEALLDRQAACALYDLPADREADVVVVSDAGTCIGARAADHDLSGLAGHRLRTHGGVSEAKVPFILSEPLNASYRLKAGYGTPTSYQIFEYALNGTQPDPA
jgi:phosphonoacetate hydrolase